jgi:WD40 repeat protein
MKQKEAGNMEKNGREEHRLIVPARKHSRRRFLVAGLTVGSVVALGAGISVLLPRLFPSARTLPAGTREFDLNNDNVNTVAWSPNGHLFAAGGGSNQVKIWRVSDGQELTSLSGPDTHAGTWSIAWSPQNKYIASTWNSAWTGNRVSIWKVPTDENPSLWPHERDLILQKHLKAGPETLTVWPMVVAWSPDGTHLAVGDSGGGLQIWDPFSGQQLRVLQASQEKAGIPVSSLSWSPDGTRIAALNVAAGAKYTVWNVATGVVTILPSQHGLQNTQAGWFNNMMTISWSPDGTALAGSSDRNVLLWQWNEEKGSWKEVRLLSVTASKVTALTWAADSQRFATADGDNKIRLWLASTGQQLGSYSISPPQVGGWWNQDSRAQEYMDTDFRINALAWAPDGKHLLSGDQAGRVLLLEIP